ncbi:hypothetical protein AG74_65 [Vibrio phage AG74]|uniref:Uncharacterized protein n=1 Tax=Vibrio phage AG74 TaxID=2736261 RepID=A0A6M9Z2E5_9CAUD|nr:hypothetical protein KNV06_gp065 [Vibrio phage AG74]QKN84924.1 hypothetical protein AG74_65 [Vibrio phage AG74]
MRFIKCAGCNKIAIEIEDGRFAKGCVVRCAKCEEKLKKELQNLRFLAKMNENKESNPLADLFGKFK